MKLTPASIRELAPPSGGGERTVFDDDTPGFGVRVRRSGKKFFVVQYKIKNVNRRLALGAVDEVDLGKARKMAEDARARVRLGGDPVAERQAEQRKTATALRFETKLPRFLARQRERQKPRSFVETNRHLTKHAAPLHKLALLEVDRRTIADLLAELTETNGPGAANRTRASLSAFFTWLTREGDIGSNPVSATNKAVEIGARSRLLSDAELVAIWRACDDGGQYSAIVRLLVLLGARRDEIAGLRWSEVDLVRATITLPPERTKTRREHVIPLSPAALAIVAAQPRRQNSDGTPRDLVFGHGARGWQDWSGSKADIDARIAAAGQSVADWRLHDFRRVMSTAMHDRLGVAPSTAEACLGHMIGNVIARTYNVGNLLDLRRAALERWADHVTAITSDKPPPTNNVVKIQRRQMARV